MESWKPVVGYEQFYEVSDMGNVKSLRTGKIRKPVSNVQNGYLMMFLVGAHERKCVYVHRLVAEAFCDKPVGCEFVNHKDEMKHNNIASNLEWVTKYYNNTYNGKMQRCCKPIKQIAEDGSVIEIWASARKASNELGIQYKNISSVCRGLRPRAGGYRWEFIDG